MRCCDRYTFNEGRQWISLLIPGQKLSSVRLDGGLFTSNDIANGISANIAVKDL